MLKMMCVTLSLDYGTDRVKPSLLMTDTPAPTTASTQWAAFCALTAAYVDELRSHQLTVCSLSAARLTNDGNAILREIEVAHPAAKSMIELSRTQDEEVGDGTTSVIILGELSPPSLSGLRPSSRC